MPRQAELYPIKYEFTETSDSLVITWHGPRKTGLFIFRLSFFILLILFIGYNTYSELLITPGSSKELFVCAGIFFVLIFAYYSSTNAMPLNLLLSEEIITVTEHSIEIKRFGLWSFVRRKEFSVTGNTIFYIMAQGLGPKYLSFYNPSSDLLIKSSPLPSFKENVQHHAFCYGISHEDSQVVLGRIKTNFPHVRLL